MRISPHQMPVMAVERLSEMLNVPLDIARVQFEARDAGLMIDAKFATESHSFVIECKASSSLGSVVLGVDQLKMASYKICNDAIPLFVAPYMSASAREYCEREGIAWLDLSGNAKIVASGLYINSVGHKNRFSRPGRFETPFGPKGSRITRTLLGNTNRRFKQRDIASSTRINEGYVSRVVRRLIDLDLVERDSVGIRVKDANRLLAAWRDDYQFDRHSVIRGHVVPPVDASVMQVFDRAVSSLGGHYAVTGLSAAWMLTGFAGYRLTTVYLESDPSDELVSKLGFREEPRGANAWLVVPNDVGVFDGARRVDEIRCVSPVQAYLDLKGHPERSSEAAEELKAHLF